MLTENIFIRLDSNYILSMIDGVVAVTEHNCHGKCVIAENGSDEAFIAGYLRADGKPIEDRMEYASFAMISALKTEFNVNEELSEAMVKRMQ